MIDLHCHSTFSDGTFIPEDILKIANEKDIKILSITDHDSVNAYSVLDNIDIKKYYKGKIVVGTEFTCIYDGYRIELLGYCFEKNNVQKWLDDYYSEDKVLKRRKIEFNELVVLCKNNNIKLTPNIKYDLSDGFPIDYIYQDIKKYTENEKLFDKDVWANITLFYRECVNNSDFILYRDPSNDLPSALTISSLIRDNSGLVFLAHPFVYYLNNYQDFLDSIVKDNLIDGLECYHTNFTKEQVSFLLEYCRKNNLFMSGGSDFHGNKYPKIELGIGYNNNLNIPDNIVKNWLK